MERLIQVQVIAYQNSWDNKAPDVCRDWKIIEPNIENKSRRAHSEFGEEVRGYIQFSMHVASQSIK